MVELGALTRSELRRELALVAASLRSYLSQQQAAGVLLPSAAQESSSTQAENMNAEGEKKAADVRIEEGVSSLTEAGDLEALRAFIGDCQRCKLAGGRTHIVFGVGNPNAEVMFVGEGPGRDEDLQAEPFVGRAGQLLTDIITKGMKMRREDVYIANVVKCRPPGNRDPQPDEVESCEPFLIRQIELIKPRVLVALGRFAVQTLLRSTTPISRLRGNWHDYHGIKLMPTFHPAYLLRNPGDKRLVWEDIKNVLRELGHEIP